MAASETGNGNNFSTVSDGAAIRRVIPTLSTMPDFNMSLRTLSDVVDYRDSRWRPPKPEMEITTERNELATSTFVTLPDPIVTWPDVV